ncbi:MAG: VOC family protein [Chloroflexota bacterium]|nr:VOC family protein [Chloroflexota bacterium]
MPDLTLDHVVIAVTDLDAATRDYIALLGRAPSWRGEHPSYGTRNTLFRIDNTYVELLALGGLGRDPRWAGELARFLELHGEGLMTLAIGAGDVDRTAAALRKSGLEVADPADGQGIDAATGAHRAWRNALVPPKSTNGARIFLIQHKSPAEALPVAPAIGLPGAHVERMDHAVVLSADMEAARRVWQDKIGARLALDRTFPERNTRILFFRLGDITIEISGGAEQAKEGMGKPDRLWGLAWGVGDLEATCERLAQEGILTSGPRPGIKPGTLVATAKGPSTHGVATLLIEHTPRSFQPESRAAHGMAYDNTPQKRAFTATGLDHVVLSTGDLEATTAKWASILDLYASDSGRPKGTGFRLAKLPAGNAFVELVQPLSADHRIARTMAERGQGMYSISVRVDNLDAAIADLRAKGVPVSDPEPGIWSGTRIARIPKAAANGVSLQMIAREAT